MNVDVELALFEADHGDPDRAVAADARAGWRSRRQHPRRRRVGLGPVSRRSPGAGGTVERPALRLGTRTRSRYFHAGMIALRLGDRPGTAAPRGRAAINPHFSILYATSAQRTLARLHG